MPLSTTIAGKTVGRLGLGCYPLTGGYGEVDAGQGFRMIHAALDAGVRLLDTSDAYAAGANEELVGRAVADRRDAVVVCTKFGWAADVTGKALRLDSSPAHVRRACEASLTRLRTDYIDLYLQHRQDPTVPIEDTVGELLKLRDEGKVRSIGLCEVSVDTLARAHRVMPVEALQTEYSLWSREPEADLLPACTRLGITFIAYSPLGRGFLSGRIRRSSDLKATDFRRTHPRFEGANLSGNLALVDRLGVIAERLGHTPSQLALAWLLARPWGVIPIPATTSLQHFEENLKALELELTPSDLDEIGKAIPPAAVHGARHPAEHMKTINQ
jgi:aryl-alcohol dehydrogenase-like predicted oxidoreductase